MNGMRGGRLSEPFSEFPGLCDLWSGNAEWAGRAVHSRGAMRTRLPRGGLELGILEVRESYDVNVGNRIDRVIVKE